LKSLRFLIPLLLMGCAHAPVERVEPINQTALEANASEHNHDVLNCYQARLKGKPSLEGELQLDFDVTTAGEMKDARIAHPFDTEVELCVLREAKTWKFPWNIRKGTAEVGMTDKFTLHVEGKQPRVEFKEIQQDVDKDGVRQVVRTHVRDIRKCYESRLNDNPQVAGQVVLEWDIDETGGVKAPRAKDSVDKPLEDCLIGKLKTWKFPTPPKSMVSRVSYPFYFQGQ
jgi:hypothetical protein